MAQPTKWFSCSIDGCDRPGPYMRSWCWMHYMRWRRHGDPEATHHTALLRQAAATDSEECVRLPKPTSYPRPVVKLDGKRMTAARAVWVIAHGDPGDLHVLHKCNGGSGVNGCINIRHLYLGTPADNARDRLKKLEGLQSDAKVEGQD